MHSIMIVEDERIVARDLQQTLASMGYDAFAIASSAEEALGQASQRCPDLVLMDIRIKGARDGIDTAALLHDRFGVPIVYLTAHADEATLERAKRTEPYGYLMKPVRTAELRSMIEISIHRHQLDVRLRSRERSSTAALSTIADAVIAVDLTGSVSFMNPAAEALAGITAAAAVGRPVREVIRLLDPSSAADRPVRAGDPSSRAAVGAAPRTSLDTTSPIMEHGKVTGAIMVIRDVPSRDGPSPSELAERLTALGTLAAGLAHEMNSPLEIVAANASYVLEELRHQQRRGDHDASRVGEVIQAQVELEAAAVRIGRIVAELQAFARPAQPIAGEADVAAAVATAVQSTAPGFRGRATVVTDVAAGTRARIDDLRLGQILVNLLGNAAHATPEGAGASVSVVARVQGDMVVIEVRDAGSGMAPDVLARIFEPFYTTKPIGAGLGLGLAVCHGLVRSVGGQIEAESQVGLGSVFRVRLPAVVRAEPRPAVEPVVAARPRRGRLLVVDDEPMMLKAITRTLRGHDVVCIDDARQVAGLLDRGERFDVIFSDLMMPHMSGMELYECLLVKYPRDAHRVVFVTGGVVNGRVADFLSVVSNVCLQKPMSSESLRSFVQDRLASAEAAPDRPSGGASA